MTDSLKGREDVMAFLEAGRPTPRNENPANKPKATTSETPPEERIGVTVRLPKAIAHALIDASAERRKKREAGWSQQDIVAEALAEWLKRSIQ